jgi:predicted nucleic acid-binding protein
VKYVLDANIVTCLLKGDERVLGHLAHVEPSDVGIPLLVLAELLFGAKSRFARSKTAHALSR